MTNPLPNPARDYDKDFPHLGFAPCPGYLFSAQEVARAVRSTANSLVDISHVLNGTGKGNWRGEVAEEFRKQFHDNFRPKVSEARDSFRKAASALEDWADYMEFNQKKAMSLEREAEEYEAAAEKANKELKAIPIENPLDALRDTSKTAEEKRKRAEKDRATFDHAATAAEAKLEDVRKRARTLKSSYEKHGAQIAQRLKEAGDIAPNEPGMLKKIGAAIGALDDFLKSLGDAVLDALKKYGPILDIIANVAGLLSTVLGLLSLIPGLNFLALPALALGGISLVTRYLQVAGQEGSFSKALGNKDVLIGAVTLAFGAGAFGAGIKLAKAGSGLPYGTLVADSMKLNPTVSAYPSFFKSVMTAPETLRGSDFALQLTRFTGTWSGNIAGIGPGDGYDNVRKTYEWLSNGGSRPGYLPPSN